MRRFSARVRAPVRTSTVRLSGPQAPHDGEGDEIERHQRDDSRRHELLGVQLPPQSDRPSRRTRPRSARRRTRRARRRRAHRNGACRAQRLAPGFPPGSVRTRLADRAGQPAGHRAHREECEDERPGQVPQRLVDLRRVGGHAWGRAVPRPITCKCECPGAGERLTLALAAQQERELAEADADEDRDRCRVEPAPHGESP